MCPYNSRQQTPGWSSVSVFKTNLLPYSLKHTHTHTEIHWPTHKQMQPATNTHFSYSFNLFLFVCGDEKAGTAMRMDGQRADSEGREETAWRIHYSCRNECFVRNRGDINIHQPVCPLPPRLIRRWQRNESVCVSDRSYFLGQISEQSRFIGAGSSNRGQKPCNECRST